MKKTYNTKSYSSTDYNYTIKCVCRWIKTEKKIWKQLCWGCGLVRISCNCVSVVISENWYHRHNRGRRSATSPPPRSTSENSSNSHSRCKPSTVRDAVLGSHTAEIFQVPSVTPFMLKEESAATRQGDNRCPGAEPSRSCYFSFARACAGSSRWEPDLPSSPWLGFLPSAAAVIAKCQLSPECKSKYCNSPTSSTNGTGHWWGRIVFPGLVFLH